MIAAGHVRPLNHFMLSSATLTIESALLAIAAPPRSPPDWRTSLQQVKMYTAR
jgi:hypothetical protein